MECRASGQIGKIAFTSRMLSPRTLRGSVSLEDVDARKARRVWMLQRFSNVFRVFKEKNIYMGKLFLCRYF